MDLRSFDWTDERNATVERYVAEEKIGYQPFVFRDDLEVGEGLNFLDTLVSDDGAGHSAKVYWPNKPDGVSTATIREEDFDKFRVANSTLRRIYDYFVEEIVRFNGGVSGRTIAEMGCNTSYFLQSLALEGAKCHGFDLTDNRGVVELLNGVLGTDVEFHLAEWDSLRHTLRYTDMVQADIQLNIAVACHVSDPLHFLSYFCDHASSSLFFWLPHYVDCEDVPVVHYGEQGLFAVSRDWPLGFDCNVRPSRLLIERTLEQCGFGDIEYLAPPTFLSDLAPIWTSFWESHVGVFARRTSERRSAVTTGRSRLPIQGHHLALEFQASNFVTEPDDAPRLLTSVPPGNLVRYKSRYFFLPSSAGQLNLEELSEEELAAIPSSHNLERLFEKLIECDGM